VRDRLAQIGEVVMNSSNTPWTRNELMSHLADATAMMGFMTDCVDAETTAGAPHLQIVAAALKGFDSYDVEACTSAGVWLTIVPDLLTDAAQPSPSSALDRWDARLRINSADLDARTFSVLTHTGNMPTSHRVHSQKPWRAPILASLPCH